MMLPTDDRPDHNYWISWCHVPADGEFEMHWPWWVSGMRMSDDADTICAAVRAPDEDAARELVYAAYDTRPAELEFRFCSDRPDAWTPYTDRFPRADWNPDWPPP